MAIKRQSGLSKILGIFKPNTGKEQFLLFILAFAVICGGYFAYRSSAAAPTYVRFLNMKSMNQKSSI